jgi:N-acetylglucosaminyldiphosphoundecaprenol N-acetyl-beta-D-mannosaminyltransferase
MRMTLTKILGIEFANTGLRATIAWLAARVGEPGSGPPCWFACVNPHSVETARRDPEFMAAIRAADLVTPDGTGIVIAARILGGALRERVCGPDIFPMLCARLNAERPGTRMFFLGASAATLAALQEKFTATYPALVCAGAFAPPFRAQFSAAEDAAMIARVNAARADVLWVGLGAPKQEKWVHRNCDRLQVRLIGPVGGVFDFFTGRVRLPPPWAQRRGLIWLFRLCQEPRRLWRRNLDGPVFLARVLWQRMALRRNP